MSDEQNKDQVEETNTDEVITPAEETQTEEPKNDEVNEAPAEEEKNEA